MFLSLKTLSFLYNHSDQITTNAPTVIIILNLRPTPFCQLSNMLAMLHIGYMVKPIWMSDHMDLASLTLKNKWLIVSSWCRRHTLYFVPIVVHKLVFSEDYTSTKIAHKTLVFNIIFIFHLYYYYQPALLAGLMLSTWNPQKIYHSHVNYIDTLASLVQEFD
jgi:hypothetical protein